MLYIKIACIKQMLLNRHCDPLQRSMYDVQIFHHNFELWRSNLKRRRDCFADPRLVKYYIDISINLFALLAMILIKVAFTFQYCSPKKCIQFIYRKCFLLQFKSCFITIFKLVFYIGFKTVAYSYQISFVFTGF